MPIFGPRLTGPARLTDLQLPASTAGPHGIALVSANKQWTWRELERDIGALAAHLIALGLRKGDRVASLMPNRGELLVHYLACLRAGLVVTPLNYRYTPPEIDYALGVTKAAVLLAHTERADALRAAATPADLPLGTISFGGPVDGAIGFDDLVSAEPPDTALPAPENDAPAFVFFTSGSTAKPKGVTHSLNSFGSIVASWAQSMALTTQDVVLPMSSIAHVAALATSLAGLHAGARVVMAESLDAGSVLPLLRTHRPSVLVTLPSSLIPLAGHQDATHDDFGSLRLCITGGDKFPASIEEEFTDRTGLVVNETYGLTEATACLFNASDPTAKAGSAGTVCPGYAASLRDDNGREVSAGVDANLWLQGPPVMIGYWDDPAATTATTVDGWFSTGDVMRVDADGYFWFRGRKKHIIVHDGSNITPEEIEEAVIAHPAVKLAAVVGVPDEAHGENVWAYVTLKDGVTTAQTLDIIRCARERVGYKAPELVTVLDEMPMNAVGKIDRMALKELAARRPRHHDDLQIRFRNEG